MDKTHKNTKSLNLFLREIEVDPDIRSLLYHMARGVKYINFSIRSGNTDKADSSNASGEDQVALDIIADRIIMQELKNSGLACSIVSEEQDDIVYFPCKRSQKEKFSVTYDPLDGSSLVDANLAIGSIFGIWKDCGDFIGHTGNDIVASAYAVYGPRITFTIAIKGKGVHEFELNDVGEFILTHSNQQIQNESEHFAPGNVRATAKDPKYLDYITHCMKSQKVLRHSGGMVPDLHHILSKKNGVFTYPRMEGKYPNGKLRLLFECAPFAFVFEEAGGLALDQMGNRILDKEITDIHQRIPIIIGSKNAVHEALKFLKTTLKNL